MNQGRPNSIAHDLISSVGFLLEGMIVDVVSDASTETVLYADVPIKVQQKITYTEPGLKGEHSHQHAETRHGRIRATVRVRCSSTKAGLSKSILATVLT